MIWSKFSTCSRNLEHLVKVYNHANDSCNNALNWALFFLFVYFPSLQPFLCQGLLYIWTEHSILTIRAYNMFVTSKKRNHQFINSPIHEFKVLQKAREHFKTSFNGVLFLVYYFNNHFKPCFFILQALTDILQPFKFVNWWIRGFIFFDVTNSLLERSWCELFKVIKSKG